MLPQLIWEKRPFEIRNLLNPAFCAILLYNAIEGYFQESDKRGMPYPLIFLILPLVLHKATRESLPQRIDANFDKWIQDDPQNFISFWERVHFLNAYTKEAIIFGMQYDCFKIRENGYLFTYNLSSPKTIWNEKSESMQCYESANFIGRWFADTGAPATIFRILGVRP